MDVPDRRLAMHPPVAKVHQPSQMIQDRLRECPDASGAQFLSAFGNVYIVVAFFLSFGTPSDPQS